MKENKTVMKQISSLALLALSVLLACCSQDELSGGIIPPGNSLYISSAIIASGSHSETEATTRGDILLVPVTKGSLGIFRSKGTGYASALDNMKYTYTVGKGWQPAAASDTIFLNGDDAAVCAYYPHDVALTDKTSIPLTSGKYTGTVSAHDPNDICYAANRTLNGYNRATTFEMKHAMAMLELKITKDANYKGDCHITSVSILNPALVISSTIDISTGTYAAAPTKGTVAYNPGADANGILIGTTASTTAALLIPFNPTADGLSLSFAVNDMPVVVNIGTDKLPAVEAGNRYIVNLTMKATSMQVTGVDMMPWEETGVGGDDYVWYPKEDAIKLDAPIHLAGYKWAWSNLDYADGKIALRDYQTWPDNYLVHWPYCVLTPNLTDFTVAGNTAYSYATDPCSALNSLVPGGTTWALPTRHQMELLMATGHINEAGGCWFGTTTAPGKDDGTYLFLPANTDLYRSDGSPDIYTGAYWMSDAGSTTLFCVGTWYADHFGIIDKGTDGFPYNAMVRCVEKARETITIDGVEWAMGNLVKKDDGTFVIDEHQAAVPALVGGSVTAGYHFTWNSLGIHSASDTWEYDADNDPCTKVAPAGTWHTPTKEEFQKAIDKGIVTNGTYVINNKTINGFYLGTTTQPAVGEGDNYLFLPNTGTMSGSSYVESDLGYWTSSGGSGNPISLYNDGSVGSNASKYTALPVRCVKGSKVRPTHTIEVDGLNFYVADGNLMVTSNGAGGYTYTFAGEQGSFGGSASSSDYFAWNTLLPDGGNGTQTVWDDTRDACRKVGDGKWRTPTKEDFEALIGTGYYYGTYNVSSVGNVNGVYLGTTSQPGSSSQNNFLFLPAAGFWGGGSFVSNGEGRYWTATLVSGSNNAYYLSIGNAGSVGMGSFYTSPACPLRCIYDK